MTSPLLRQQTSGCGFPPASQEQAGPFRELEVKMESEKQACPEPIHSLLYHSRKQPFYRCIAMALKAEVNRLVFADVTAQESCLNLVVIQNDPFPYEKRVLI